MSHKISIGYDGYLDSEMDRIKNIKREDFVKLPTRKYPSSWDKIIVDIAKKKGKIRYVHESMMRYGLTRIHEILSSSVINNKLKFLKRAMKFVEIPTERYGEMFSSDEAMITLVNKTFYVSEDTKQLCIEYANEAFTTIDSMAVSSIMIAMSESAMVRSGVSWFHEKYDLNDNKIRSHLKSKNEHLRLISRMYSSQLMSVYNSHLMKIVTKKQVDYDEVKELWDILNHLRRTREISCEVVDYKVLMNP